MKSIDKLRTAARNMAKGRELENHEECNLLLVIADEIEADIAERYMLLPVDADGVPIHIGDRLETFDCPPQDYDVFDVYGFCTTAINGVDWYVIDGYDQQCNVEGVRHVKPDPLKELLLEMLDRHTDGIGLREHGGDINSFAGKYAERIRELMEVDA